MYLLCTINNKTYYVLLILLGKTLLKLPNISTPKEECLHDACGLAKILVLFPVFVTTYSSPSY